MRRTKAIIYVHGLRYHVCLKGDTPIIVGPQNQAHLHIESLESSESFSLGWKEEVLYYQDTKDEIPLKEGHHKITTGTGKALIIYITHEPEWLIYPVHDQQEILISKESSIPFSLMVEDVSFLLKRQGDTWDLTIFQGDFYVNNQRVETDRLTLEPGDTMAFGAFEWIVFPHEMHLTEGLVQKASIQNLTKSRYSFYRDYPDFHRSPRIIYREPEEKITVKAPPDEEKKPTDQLLKLIIPPLIMMTVSGIMIYVRPNAIYMIASVAMSISTLIFSITNFIKNRKEYKQALITRKEDYKEYLANKSKELYEIRQKQRNGQRYHYPDIETLDQLTSQYSARIYEKTPTHFDFLTYRLGLGEVDASAQIEYSNKEREKKGDELEVEGFNLYHQSLKLEDMPITSDLVHGPVGYIGLRHLVIEQLHLLVNQLATFHSYHDLQIVSVFPEEEKSQWEWMRWFPHTTLQQMNVRGFVYNQRSRDQVLNSLNAVLKNRKNQQEERGNNRENTIFTPHYIIIVVDKTLILDHVIMEFLNEDPGELGCSIIFVEDLMSSLSDNVKTVVDIRDGQTGVLVLQDNDLKNTTFTLDHFPENFNKEAIPRRLAGLNHLQNLKSAIPEAVTFMELYNVERFEELSVVARWEANAPHKSLAVPLGLRGKDDIVYLDLHEKAHGPHGLVAGTTGSGKSEIIQSYILSLAVNFHPHDVAFLLIDYKGGGMANLFKDLPHLLGTITNLDGAQSMRALTSINAELRRRQTLFAKYDLNHINQYQRGYKNGEIQEPMPHLFMISDEFAELKAEQPEFMDELVSTARIGRSLGIHLILATQKPSGVVNDQIWSNSRFKLALKVADKNDSKEILKTPDAAEITQPGRAYLQVGNNEIYELFQSAWSGADHQADKDDQNIEDHTLYKINDLGQYEILNEDLSGLENAQGVQRVPTELEAIVEGIHQVVEERNIPSLPQPWLPPLPDTIYLTQLNNIDFREAWEKPKAVIKPVIGMVDIPSEQSQETLTIDLSRDGHMAVYASPGYGKSTFIQTVIMGLARAHNPANLHVYLLDFGTNGLLPLKGLPHIADMMRIDDEEKIGKFIRRIRGEINRRKKLLSEHAVANLEMYEKASGKEEPVIMLALDGYEGMKTAKFNDDLEALITFVAREGAGVGIHLILSAGRQSSMRMNLYSNIKVQIPLKLIDDTEARNVVGRTQLLVEDQPGRGLIKLEEPQSFQTALPAEGEDTLEIIENIRKEAETMDQAWTGERAKPIPMVPEVLHFEDFKNRRTVQEEIEAGNVPMGLDYEQVEAVGLQLNRCKNLLVMSDREENLGGLMNHLLQVSGRLLPDVKVLLLDSEGTFREYETNIDTYIAGEDQLQKFSTMLLKEINRRKAIETYEPWLIFIDRLDTFVRESKVKDNDFKTIFEEAPKMGMYLMIGTYYNYVGSSFDAIPKFVKGNIREAIFSMRLMDQNIFDKPYNNKEPQVKVDEAYYYKNNSFTKLKITK